MSLPSFRSTRTNAEDAVVEDEVDVEVISLERDALLPAHEAEALAQLEEEVFEAIDDHLLEVPLVRGDGLTELEELEDERILDDVVRLRDLLPLGREPCRVAFEREPLEEHRRHLPFQLAN